MPTFNARALPILDLSLLEDGKIDQALVDTAEQSLREVGFFVVKNHGVSDELIKNTFAISREFYDQEESIKGKVAMTSSYPYGWEKAEILSQSLTGEGVTPDPKETYNIKVAEPRWPDTPADFKPIVTEYTEAMWRLTNKILHVFAVVLRQPVDFFDDKFPNTQENMTVFRLLNYPHVEPGPDRIRASQHTDYGVLTILGQDNVGGLQVKLPGQEWENVSTPPGCLLVNIGDMMQRWSNDSWRSTLHRVVSLSGASKTNNRRQSMAFFVNPGKNVMIECIGDYKKEGEEAKYPAIRAEEYILGKHYSTIPSIMKK
eukprot:sb/3466984/